MKVLLVAPPRIAPNAFRRHGSRASEHIHRFFRQIIQQDKDSRFLLLDSKHPHPKILTIPAEDHLKLASRDDEMTETPLDHILQRLALADKGISVVLTWGEWGQLRCATERLGIHYVSLQHAAPGSRTLNLLHLNASSTKPEPTRPHEPGPPDLEALPAYATHIANELHYAKFDPLASHCGSLLYHPEQISLVVVVGAEGECRGMDCTNLSDTLLSKVLPQLEELIGPVMDAGANCLVVTQEKSATPLARQFLKRLAQAHPAWKLGHFQQQTCNTGDLYPLMHKSDAVVSINSVVALDALREGTPVAFLGRNTEDWHWLNPAHPWSADRKKLHHDGLRQKTSFRWAKKQYIAQHHWFPNQHPSASEFHDWIAAACRFQKGIDAESDSSTCPVIGEDRHYAMSEPLHPLIEQYHQTLWQRLQNKSRRLRRKLNKLRRDPKKFFRDARTPALRNL